MTCTHNEHDWTLAKYGPNDLFDPQYTIYERCETCGLIRVENCYTGDVWHIVKKM